MWKFISKNLSSLGIEVSLTSVQDFQKWIRRYKLEEPIQTLAISSSTLLTSKERYIELSHFHTSLSGTFGSILEVIRKSPTSVDCVYLKYSKQNSGQLLHIEAILQEVSRSVLQFYGFEKPVPRVMDILRHPSHGICFTMEQTDALLFSEYLQQTIEWQTPCVKNDFILMSILAQLASYLAVLEYTLFLNHRDLTGTNVLMISPSDTFTNTLKLGELEWKLTSKHRVVLIDFGFAALGSLPTRSVLVQAGNFFHTEDPCPKDGRDLFLFLASLWKNENIRKSLTPSVTKLFYTWLSLDTKNWAEWLERDSTDMKGMYLLTMKHDFRSPRTMPLRILHDIAELYPFLVTFETRPATPTPL